MGEATSIFQGTTHSLPLPGDIGYPQFQGNRACQGCKHLPNPNGTHFFLDSANKGTQARQHHMTAITGFLALNSTRKPESGGQTSDRGRGGPDKPEITGNSPRTCREDFRLQNR
ncbi:hypothetical protein PoB_005010200 [Plakobranchus ocellatus]|uniref:Uncharacterized protein n=1 Tax=Plakobranchus ocellatus TaxID=259542 RepID=A0AAV4BWZ5_9GAST|nr:hypothetical protein PoB_005010200 [Plakobranchus ocellatus]